jgi:hypothetical protein
MNQRFQLLGIALTLWAACNGAANAQAPLAVLTQHNDIARTGDNLRETLLNTSSVNAQHFGKLWTRSVDGYLYAQPLYVQNVPIPGKGLHNVIYLATAHNSVYAFDADDPKAALPLWQINLGPSVPADEVYTTKWTDMRVEIGITSTPVIDPATNTIFVEAKTKEHDTYVQRLHALDIATGAERPGSPVEIKASVSGTGMASVNGTIAFNPVKQLQRPALLLANGTVYLAFGSHADSPPFHPWILGYDAHTLAQTCVFNGTPNGDEGSIWQAGMGMASDPAGNIYAMTGNGTFDANTGGADYGDSFLKLTPQPGGLKVTDYFAPYNQQWLNDNDLDVGSSGPILVPGTGLLLGGSKNGWLYLMQQNNLGHYQAKDDSQIVQSFQITHGNCHGSPVYWNGPGGPQVYIWPEFAHLMAFRLAGGKLNPTPASQSAIAVPDGMPGAFLSVSANGNKAGTGIVWSSAPYDANANWDTVPGVLRAYDASDLSHEVWDSKMNPARDDAGMFAKFCAPTVINGKVYLSTFSNQLQVYGLLGDAVPAFSQVTASPKQIAVTYNQTVDPNSALRLQNYSVDNGTRVLAAKLAPNHKTVLLKTTALRPGEMYTLTAGNVRGQSGPKLALPPATHAWFRPAVRGLVLTRLNIGGSGGA